MQDIPNNVQTVIEGDKNGNFGSEKRGYERLHGGCGFGRGTRLGNEPWILHYNMILR